MELLIKAVIENNVIELEKLLLQGLDCDLYEDTAQITLLHFAAQNNSYDAAKLLIHFGADVNAQTDEGLTPLDIAIMFNYDDMIELLSDYKTQINDS